MKSRYKQFWSDDLQMLWDKLRKSETVWLRENNHHKKSILKSEYCANRKEFDKLLRKNKRQYQQKRQSELEAMCENGSELFWKTIGKIGMVNDRITSLPTSVKDRNGSIVNVSEIWKNEFLYTCLCKSK